MLPKINSMNLNNGPYNSSSTKIGIIYPKKEIKITSST